MDMSTLASKMLEWEAKRKELDALTEEIEGAVLEIKQTQNVGNVRATFSGGRKSYDYMLALIEAGIKPEQLIPFTTTPTPIVDHRAACKEFKIEKIPFVQSEPSVTVKLLFKPIKDADPETIRTKAESLTEKTPEQLVAEAEMEAKAKEEDEQARIRDEKDQSWR